MGNYSWNDFNSKMNTADITRIPWAEPPNVIFVWFSFFYDLSKRYEVGLEMHCFLYMCRVHPNSILMIFKKLYLTLTKNLKFVFNNLFPFSILFEKIRYEISFYDFLY